MNRSDGRLPEQIRSISFELNIAPHASGSVLVSMGNARVICGVMIEEAVPRWMKEQAISGGWLTAEYSMLPYSTQTRKPRDIAKGRLDGRSTEIQRLIGRSLRAVVDLEKLGPRTIWVHHPGLGFSNAKQFPNVNLDHDVTPKARESQVADLDRQ